MSTHIISRFNPGSSRNAAGIAVRALAAMAANLFFVGGAPAQQPAPQPSARLSDAPSFNRTVVPVTGPPAPLPADSGVHFALPAASRYDKYIQPDQPAPRLTASDKFVLGFHDAFSPTSLVVWVLVAGYEQTLNHSPNWPQNTGGFLRRTGAAAARDTSNGVFADSVFAPIFRQDPRYYRIGSRRNLGFRLVYALSRPFVTRTDGGRAAPDVSLIAGTVFGSWLTNAYYPAINHGFDQTAETFGGSMGSSALGFVVAEFADDFLETLHLKRRPDAPTLESR